MSELYCKYISSRGICYNCDIYPDDIKSDTKIFNMDEYNNITNYDKVYVITSVINQFISKVLPELEKKKIKIILVTGASVIGVPLEAANLFNINIKNIINNSNSIIHWFCQNYDSFEINKKITPIPLGLDYHTLQKKNHWWGPKMTAINQEKELIEISNKKFNDRINKTFSFFHFQLFKRHGADRYKAIRVLQDKEYNIFLKQKTNRKDTWNICTKFKFIISPHGNGLDCHRTYEAMLLGSLPIVKSSSLDVLYKDMPVIILDNWSDINIDNLVKQSNNIINKSKEKLTLQYWNKLIDSYIPTKLMKQITDKLNYNIACCLCVRNCEIYLTKLFKNLKKLSNLFENCYFIFIYDNCSDNTEKILLDFKNKHDNVIIKNIENKSKCRTTRIAKARNECIKIIYNELENIDYHIMIDADDVNTKSWNVNILPKYFIRDDWDCLTFNRERYYDIWALLYDNIQHHCWGYNNLDCCWKISSFMRQDITKKLNRLEDGKLFTCYSAFNGFGIYRTSIFKDIHYEGIYKNFKKMISNGKRKQTLKFFKTITRNKKLEIIDGCVNPGFGTHCEHLYYHLSAIKEKNAKIRISKESL
tara:strand:- start:903 stop:2669 length:1767 start_codon:yes stop_codon:yes gene_type:complete